MSNSGTSSIVTATVMVILLIPWISFAQIDSTFGNSGIAETHIAGGGNDMVYFVDTLSNGEILLEGWSVSASNIGAFATAEYDSNGNLEENFGTGGTARTMEPFSQSSLQNAILCDGDLAIHSAPEIIYLNPSGTIDSSVAVPAITDSTIPYTSTWALAPDGDFLFAGTGVLERYGVPSQYLRIIRIIPNGKLDTTFGVDGGVNDPRLADIYDGPPSILEQQDGNLVIEKGYNEIPSTGDDVNVVARYLPDGRVDSTFGQNGLEYVMQILSASGGILSQSNGSLIVFGRPQPGYSFQQGNVGLVIERLNKDGSIDSTFGMDGLLLIPDSLSGYQALVKLQKDGKIVVAGPYVLRYDPDGRIDNSFGLGGMVKIVGFSSSGDQITCLAIQNDGKILVVGDSLDGAGLSGFKVERFLGVNPNAVTLTPVPLFPVDTSGVPTQTTFVWKSYEYAQRYRIRVSIDSSFSTVQLDTTTSDTVLRLNSPLSKDTKYYWHVCAYQAAGLSEYSKQESFTTGSGIDGVKESSTIPISYMLYQNYPNPFNPSTTIKFALPTQSQVSVAIYDILGREVKELVNDRLQAGYYQFSWNASMYASGVYFYRIVAQSLSGDRKSFVQLKKLMLIK